jgi:uncharacterized Zn finger protein
MSDRSWWADATGPIAVEGGIKARSRRGAIGERWWSRRFIGVLESYGAGMSGRLQRGKNYARRGQVIEFSLGAGRVDALVQGSRPRPYQVTITVPPLTPAQWRAVEARLAAQALFRARLLAGEMPAEIEQVFADAGTPLFPASARDLTMDCNCPDWGVPCKHLAAVCYVLAESFDDDPFEMLAWRGKTRAELLAALRGGRPGRAAGSAPSGDPSRRLDGDSPARAVLADVPGPAIEDSLADFWSPGLSQARLRSVPPSPVTPPDLLLRVAEPPSAEVRGLPLLDVLSVAYRRLAGEADEPGEPDEPVEPDGPSES